MLISIRDDIADLGATKATELVGCEVQVIFNGWVGVRDTSNPGPFGPRLDEVSLENIWAVGVGGARYQTW
jgi:hypothetical protein